MSFPTRVKRTRRVLAKVLHTLAARLRFELMPQQWVAFEAALDRPVTPKPKLTQLLQSARVAGVSAGIYGVVRKLLPADELDGFDRGHTALSLHWCTGRGTQT
jgi:hypothetical protein